MEAVAQEEVVVALEPQEVAVEVSLQEVDAVAEAQEVITNSDESRTQSLSKTILIQF